MDLLEPIRLDVFDSMVRLGRSHAGELLVEGERDEIVGVLSNYIRDELLLRAHSLADQLRTARRIQREFRGKIIDLEAIVQAIRADWVYLLKANLMPDPNIAQRRAGVYHRFANVAVNVYSGKQCGIGDCYSLGDKRFLTIEQRRTPFRQWKIGWDKIRRIEIIYHSVPRTLKSRLGLNEQSEEL